MDLGMRLYLKSSHKGIKKGTKKHNSYLINRDCALFLLNFIDIYTIIFLAHSIISGVASITNSCPIQADRK